MANLLDKYNKAYETRLQEMEAVPKKVTVDAFSVYRDCLEGKRNMECRFDGASKEGDLSLIDDNGVLVILPVNEFVKDAPYYSAGVKDRFIGIPLSVRVKEIREEENTVVVVSSYNKAQIKGSIMSAIFSELKKGRIPRSYGEVIHVSDNRVTVNILHRNILGFIKVQDWQNGYTRRLASVVKVKDIVTFDIVGTAPKKKGKDIAFILDRKPYAEDPWKQLKDFEKGDSITVQCVERPAGKSYFWGISRHVPGVEVMCNYNPNITVMNTCYYKCKVLEFDREVHMLKVVPFEQVSIGIGTVANVEYAKGKAKSIRE